MARKRFLASERKAFTVGTQVEWRNGNHWHSATVVEPMGTDIDGWDFLPVRVFYTTRTITKGDVIHAMPSNVRMLGFS